MPRTASQSENSSRLKKVLDFVKLNFGSIEWEMEGFKRKIMVNTATTSANNGSKALTFMPFSRSTSVNQVASKAQKDEPLNMKSLDTIEVGLQKAGASI